MILYHGSKEKLEKLEPRQAGTKEGVIVPEDELLEAIYVTPSYEFAVLCAARPGGLSRVDDEKMTIFFDHPERFDPNQDIYIYSFDSDKIPPENIRKVRGDDGEYDENQRAIVDIPELKPDSVERKKAIEIEKYYKLTNWKPKENSGEVEKQSGFKVR